MNPNDNPFRFVPPPEEDLPFVIEKAEEELNARKIVD